MGTTFALGHRSPVKVAEGLMILGQTPPIAIAIGIPSPHLHEIVAINRGTIIHRLGWNDQTAWLTLHFQNSAGLDLFKGEVFHCAGLEPDNYTDAKIAAHALQPKHGFACTLILVNTLDQRVATVRVYAWSNALSRGFLDAAILSRNTPPAMAPLVTREFLQMSTDELGRGAKVTWTLDGQL